MLTLVLAALRALLISRASLVVENLALRQQLAVLHRRCPRPRLRARDRALWGILQRVWSGWREASILVWPATVIRWHREAFRIYWMWRSRTGACGRPRTDAEIRDLAREMGRANPPWGAPRLRGEILRLGIDVQERTVSRVMRRQRKAPSQTWRTFLENHVKELASLDFWREASSVLAAISEATDLVSRVSDSAPLTSPTTGRRFDAWQAWALARGRRT
jgi:hypothetical protein